MNAILNSNSSDLKHCTIYTTYFPCNECAKLIIQSGIKKIIYMRDKEKDTKVDASKRMFSMTGINFVYEKNNSGFIFVSQRFFL